jgi:hypothetical protein
MAAVRQLNWSLRLLLRSKNLMPIKRPTAARRTVKPRPIGGTGTALTETSSRLQFSPEIPPSFNALNEIVVLDPLAVTLKSSKV